MTPQIKDPLKCDLFKQKKIKVRPLEFSQINLLCLPRNALQVILKYFNVEQVIVEK